MCDVDDETRDELTARLDECAAAGVRCFAVAAWNGDEGNDRARNGDGGLDREFGRRTASEPSAGWTLLGLVSFRDPPRWDAARCVSRARELGVRVVVATRASAATTRETCRLAGLQPRACASRDAPVLERSRVRSRRRVGGGVSGGYASIRGVASRAWVDGRRDGRERVERDGVGGGGNRRRRRPGAADAVPHRRTRTSRSASRDSPSSRTPSSPVASSSRRYETTSRTASRRARTSSRFTAPPPRSPPSAGSPGSTDDRRRIVRPWRRLGGVGGVDGRGGGGVRARRRRAVATTRTVAPSQVVVAASVCGVVGAATSLLFLSASLRDVHSDASGWFAFETRGARRRRRISR